MPSQCHNSQTLRQVIRSVVEQGGVKVLHLIILHYLNKADIFPEVMSFLYLSMVGFFILKTEVHFALKTHQFSVMTVPLRLKCLEAGLVD